MKTTLPLFLFFVLVLPATAQDAQWTNVQWACEVIACSQQYSSEDYASVRALGAPDVFLTRARASSYSYLFGWDEKTDTEVETASVMVKFCTPQKANRLLIAESSSPGSITKVILYDENDRETVVYEGIAKKIPQEKRLWQITFPFTPTKIRAVKIIGNPKFDVAWNAIDGIGICESVQPIAPPRHAENLGQHINSEYSEAAPQISANGKTLYFMRGGHPDNAGAKVKDEDQDVWYSTQDENGVWTEAVSIGKPINNTAYNWPVSISPDEQVMILSGTYDSNGDFDGPGMSYSTRLRNGWSLPQKIEIENYSTKTKTVDFTVSANKKYILFGMNPETEEHHDLYVSFLQEDGSYSTPKPLGSTLNTDGSEMGPFLASDNVTLYFSSNGHGGYGSNDIFVTKRLDDTWEHWSEPVNLGSDINSDDYDSDFSISAKGDYAYFTTYGDSYGRGDIARIALREETRPNPVVLIQGKVLNKKTKRPLGAKVLYERLSDGSVEGSAQSDPTTGEYKVILPYGHNYGYRASAEGFYPISENLELTSVNQYKEITKDLYLVPIEVGETVRLNNIFFDSGKYDILPPSFPELKRLIQLLQTQPDISIEIAGHTDNVGSDEANLNLSRNRAQAVVNYVVENGIDASRIRAKGYGETKPVAENSTDEGRQQNRRVEFTIMEK